MPLSVSRRRFLIEWLVATTSGFVVTWVGYFMFLKDLMDRIFDDYDRGILDPARAGSMWFWFGLCICGAQGLYLFIRLDRKCGVRWLFLSAPTMALAGFVASLVSDWSYDLFYHYFWDVLPFSNVVKPLFYLSALSFFSGLLVGIAQRWVLRHQVSGRWLLWVGASVAGWWAAVVVCTAVTEIFGLSSEVPKTFVSKVLIGVWVGLPFGIPLGAITGLALWKMLSRASSVPAVEGSAQT